MDSVLSGPYRKVGFCVKFSLPRRAAVFIAVFVAAFALLSLPFLTAQEALSGGSVVSAELIFPLQTEHAHGSSLAELPNGDLLAVWFQGSGERTANDVRLLGSRLKKGTSAWSEPFPMADTPGIPDCNPVLFFNGEKKLFLVWIAVLADRWEESVLRLRTSVDYSGDGAPVWNWQDNILFKPTDEFAEETAGKIRSVTRPDGVTDEQFNAEVERILAMSGDLRERSLGWMTRIVPIQLASGRILLPLYSDGFNFSLIAISDDQGETWRPSRPIIGLGIQPSLAENADGSITAYMRNASGDPERVWISRSTDAGETWSLAERSEMKSTASVDLFRLNDGRWIYVADDTDSGRWRLSLFVSHDEGKTWVRGETLEHDPTETNRYSYPCVIQSADGRIHVSYSYHLEKERLKAIKHVVIDPNRLP